MQVKTTHKIYLSILKFTFYLAHPTSCHQHGIVLRSQFESKAYCGTRIPWSMITEGDTLVIYLTIRAYKDYHLQVYYSSFHTNWISDISSVESIYSDWFLSFDITKPYSAMSILSYEYYVMSHPDNYVKIYVTSNTFFNGHLTVHDGPGSLSPKLLEYKDLQTTDWQIKTLAFWAFIHIVLFDFDISSYLPLQITAAKNIATIPLCANDNRNIIVAKSHISKNSICMDEYYITEHYITLTVDTFLFSGPSMVTDLSDSVCQYGGLLVQFHDRTNEYGYCEPLHDYTIYTGSNSINVILVWFAGYSSGHFSGFLGRSDCRAYYPEFANSPIEPLYEHGEATLLHGCTMFVSPSLVTEDTSPFYIKLGPPALGSAGITITHLNTLSSCEPEYYQPEQGQDVRITVQTISSVNWPLNADSVVNNNEIPFSSFVHQYFHFEYLDSAKILLPHKCTPGLIKLQLAVITQVSTCVKKQVEGARLLIINNIPSLAYQCRFASFQFTPTGVTRSSYVRFIHPDTGHVNNAHKIHLTYYKCPVECRFFRYKTFIRSEDGETVFEYTTRVGQTTYIRRHHRGFMVEILQPDQLCQQHMTCQLELFSDKIVHKVDKSDDHPTLHFYDKR